MSDQEKSDTETPHDGWGVNDRGYIQGGFDTPIFLQAKQRFNSDKTDRKYKEKKLKNARLVEQALPLLIDAYTKDTHERMNSALESLTNKEQNA